MVIATAATTHVIASATDDEGLINQAFKLTMIIGLALAIGVGVFLIYQLTTFFDGLSFTSIRTLTGSIIYELPVVGPLATAGTFLLSAFGFGGRN
jgi:hypothetical protein